MRVTHTALSLLTLASVLALSGCGDDGPAAQALSSVSSTLTDPASGADCAGKDVRLTRDDSEWILHGECGTVTITASRGAMNLDTARSIRLEGSNFTVLNRQLGQLSVSGHANTLNLTDVDRVDIQGNKNLVLARAVKQVRFSGNDNAVNPSSKPALDDRGSGNKVM
ncbi:DUF3060 domain-containing protein [Xanthomonas citri pv. fuscans CFBP 6996]|uniref:DUF3060 domain-containing protein n=1 Tax=Xanthomonas citri TaxID=346 RepID=UPI000C18F71F|nr:DUF3060 domain-containing protein [Xanthomonas citri]ATS51266.1 DUF3060 domain-containing protein [Xanthomonas citri pv. phaseoli var. fuscans]ATS56998.1 DUF3060 domain-containing protein [Xanthomonas citri pv. phaseoli var. fuscans]ATS58999.1 DUF3060 domain-containing protein [Xanthomonas citri pv. phaseoli var. fuscans]PTY31926.1 DUF3060 domain-containing protein [Xanthomonas citri pv. fuscans CFBP 6996]QWN15875.1 DUF3060 domain-containing protein [Xanthomonas citri]